ncbi:MAG: STAS-like domain-containing protein [Bacteroidetes bacterium]|nr:STAS-like domain-containing protein [Bacteroidota bacterium]MBU1678789.1 STAS-like domain-containing protein [Bacteroidota bacterium]
MKLFLKNIVPDTYTNASGFVLLTILNKYFQNGDSVILSFKGASPPSSSFLNSSIGELLDAHGFDKLKTMIRFIDLTLTQAQSLKHYFNTCGCKI